MAIEAHHLSLWSGLGRPFHLLLRAWTSAQNRFAYAQLDCRLSSPIIKSQSKGRKEQEGCDIYFCFASLCWDPYSSTFATLTQSSLSNLISSVAAACNMYLFVCYYQTNHPCSTDGISQYNQLPIDHHHRHIHVTYLGRH